MAAFNFRIMFLLLVSLLIRINASSQSAVPAKPNQPVAEPVIINYSGLQKSSGGQFYMMFIFGSGGDFHDSKSISQLPAGSLQLKPLVKAGRYDIIIYSYTDIRDSKPKQLAKVSFRGVNIPLPETKKTVVPNNAQPLRKTNDSQVSRIQTPVEQPNELLPKFSLITPGKIQVDVPITIHYNFRPLNKADHYNISISRPDDKYIVNISDDLTSDSGSVVLKPIYQAGIYELKVHETIGQLTEIVYRQPVTVGDIDKNFSGRYNCNGNAPGIMGKIIPGAPQVNLVTSLIQSGFSVNGLDPWIGREDVCIEYSGIRYLPVKSIKTKNGRSSRTVVVSSYPVNLSYKIIVNDFYRKQSTIKEENKVFYFYKSGSKWEFQRS